MCTSSNFNETNTIEIENFTVGLSEDLEFVPEGLPNPVLQLGFEANISWVLNENPNEY
ncbi:hypothetical protein [Neobacillus drentensis]|uniref:hypothetical protein n=1 Tax=Neobacillus drentensis TaxID=220684 RepID=UPI003002B0B5